jgi:hypothetical protein
MKVALCLAGGIPETLPLARVKSIRTEARVSLMAENLLQFSTTTEAADLLVWLKSLVSP